jgi:aspartyl-tRNA(Asn)/glutamyl-tRNA(Gln) amidotransferase subunit B
MDMANYFEVLCDKTKDAKISANWLIGELFAYLNKQSIQISQSPVSAEAFSLLLLRIKDNTFSGKIAKDVFLSMAEDGESADQVIDKKGLKQITDTGAIESIVDEVIANNPGQVAEYKAGKEQLLGFFVGQVMKASKGKANPGQVNQLLKTKL